MSWPVRQWRERIWIQAGLDVEAVNQRVLQPHRDAVKRQNLALACRHERMLRG